MINTSESQVSSLLVKHTMIYKQVEYFVKDVPQDLQAIDRNLGMKREKV